MKSASKVCLLGQTVVDNLFGAIDPLEIVRIKKIPFKVVGILDIKGQTPLVEDQDDTVFVPVTTAQKKLFGTSIPGMVRIIMVKAKNKESLRSAENQINNLLRQRHRIGPKDEDDFTVRNITQYMEMAEQASKVMAILLGSIASVSLLVGGIGIMNIMLASVTERTREIGIRMAVGAKTTDIRFQFMTEALYVIIYRRDRRNRSRDTGLKNIIKHRRMEHCYRGKFDDPCLRFFRTCRSAVCILSGSQGVFAGTD